MSSLCVTYVSLDSVPFPTNRYGEFAGYKTDHDSRRRATSVGPYTSRQMTEKLEQDVLNKRISLLDHTQVIQVISNRNTVYGLLCLDTKTNHFVLIRCKNVVWGTGGPGGMYENSVYPVCHFGATGLALEAGVRGKNLTEWQFGLASTRPRWNVSGTYMQVLPRVFSCREDGTDEREFLLDFYKEPAQMLSRLFLKGYQWPFDVRKVSGGSSMIDILVYLETCKGRKVYLDYRQNPQWGNFRYSMLQPEALDYLQKAGACFGTPLQRLQHMNAPAVEFYREKGVDLSREPLEIMLCAQHNNGGLAIDCWWQTNVEGFFAVGEAAASHGVYRPGGTALNASQVGSIRAAQYIAARRQGEPADNWPLFEKAVEEMGILKEKALSGCGGMEVSALWHRAARQMSVCAGAIRNGDQICAYRRQVEQWLEEFPEIVSADEAHLKTVFRLRDMLMSQRAYLGAMENYMTSGGKSRGSALYSDLQGTKPDPQLPDTFTFCLDDGSRGNLVQEVSAQGKLEFFWRPVRPIPKEDNFFENIWRSYRENGNIDS